MKAFLRSISGRILLAAVGIGTGGAAIAAALSGQTQLVVFSIATFLMIPLGLFALGLGIDESPGGTILAVIILPFALFLYQVGMSVVLERWPGAAYLAAPFAAGVLVLAAFPRQSTRAHGAHGTHGNVAATAAPRGA